MQTRDDPVAIQVDEQHIAGTLVTPGALIPGVLFVHGWGGSQEQYVARARSIAALGCICLTFDLRGHAGTLAQNETVTRDDNLKDVVAAYDTLMRQRGIERSAVAVVGSSYGGYLAALLTLQRPVRWLALRAPALYKDTDWELPKGQLRKRQELDAYRMRQIEPQESRALAACAAFAGHALVVESERDSVIPAQVIGNYRNALANAASLTARCLHGADHGLTDERAQEAYTRVLVDWLREMIQDARSDSVATPVVTGASVR